MTQVTEVVKLRRRVLTEMARRAYAGNLAETWEDILTTVVTEDGPRYRCCVYKERAVLKERIKIALSQPADLEVGAAVQNALRGEVAAMPAVQVMPIACDQCPIDKFLVTNACRNCLAHFCINSCPKKAIMVVQNRAYIDKSKCVECGLCKKSCPYGAIIEVSRPCESACDLSAITAGNDRKAVIHYDKCVECGCCKTACPFGAIADRSELVQIIQAMKAGKKVHAILAPAFIGQFGAKIKPFQVINGLKQAGFAEVGEVSYGADITTMEETREFLATVPSKKPLLTTSCCPAFVGMVKKHLPELEGAVSTTFSPMLAAGAALKNKDRDAVVVFVGPCIAKKVEAQKYPGVVDYVATFEEIACLLVGAGVNLAEMKDAAFATAASKTGNDFARAGGVAESVIREAEKTGAAGRIKMHRCEGLKNCKTALMMIKAGKIDANFFEGMACEGGCIGGPGTLTNAKVTGKLVELHAKTSPYQTAGENKPLADMLAEGGHWHTK